MIISTTTTRLLVRPLRSASSITGAAGTAAGRRLTKTEFSASSYTYAHGDGHSYGRPFLGRQQLALFSTAPPMEKQQDDEAAVEDDKKVTTTKMTSTTTTTTSAVASKSSPSSSILSGIALSAATATAGFAIADVVSATAGLPLSGIPVSILLGMTIKNTVGVLPTFQPGVTFSTKTILQGGIVAVAAKLSFVELLATGTTGLPVVIASMGAGLTLIPIAGRIAGLPKEMSLLLTAGTSICGVTAITALAPAINANNRDIAVAVANTVAFGTIGMLTYPYLFNSICHSSEQIGMCLGVSIHDTSQVLGAAMSYNETFGDDVALKTAAITKLTRNLGLAFALPGLTYAHAIEQQKQQQQEDQSPDSASVDVGGSSTTSKGGMLGGTISGLNTFQKYVPPFLVAFVGMSCLRSTGDLFLDAQSLDVFQQAMGFVGSDLSKYALGTAMAGVGLSTSTSSLKGVGWKPFAVGGAGALTVGGVGFAVASIMV
jgi:uncharacterized integral membrane protein (TIGR00698 family)